MDILLTYDTALEMVRSPEFPELERAWDERTGEIPDRIPGAGELRRVFEENPALESLARPLQLLVSTDATAHSCALYTRRVTRFPHPPESFVRIGDSVLTASPELLAIQMSRKATRSASALLMSELCGTYIRAGGGDALPRSGPLTSKRAIVHMINRMSGAHGARRARDAVPLACERAGSPEEARLAVVIQAPPSGGGFGMALTSPNEAGIGHLWNSWASEGDGGGLLLVRPLPVRRMSAPTERGVVIRCARREVGSAASTQDRAQELADLGIRLLVIYEDEVSDPAAIEELLTEARKTLRLPALGASRQNEKTLELLAELERVDETG